MAVRVTHRLKEWRANEQVRLKRGLSTLATVIHRDASTLAPKDQRHLVNSGKIALSGLKATVSFGGGPVKYAKRREYENKKNPHTRLYLTRAGDTNSRNFRRYL